jgi:hypothetical protein
VSYENNRHLLRLSPRLSLTVDLVLLLRRVGREGPVPNLGTARVVSRGMDLAVVTVNLGKGGYLCLVPALPCIRGAAGISTSPCGAQLLRTYRSYYGGTRARPHISLAHGDGSLFPRSGME